MMMTELRCGYGLRMPTWFVAALTYVAALFSSVLQLLRLMMLTRGGDSRRK